MMLAFFAALGARLLPVRRVLGAVPPKVWLALAIALAAFLGFLWHQHAAHKAINAAYQHGKADEAEHVRKQALELKAKADKVNAAITANERMKNDQAHRRIDADAGAVFVRGPGRAVCPGGAGPSSAPVRHEQAAPETGDAVAKVPDSGGQQLIALPFAPTVELVRQHDQCLVDLQSVVDQHAQLQKAWPKHPDR